MKPFKFSLQALYTVRLKEEQEHMEKYAQSVSKYMEAMRLLKQAENEMDACDGRLKSFHKRGGMSDELKYIQQLKESAAQKCRQRFDEVKLAQQLMEDALSKWLSAKKAKEVVEKFKQRQKSRYELDCRREEQKLLDEMKGNFALSLDAFSEK